MPALVELVGLPGSGKSTASGTLLERDSTLAPMPILRHGPQRGTLVRAIPRTLGTLARRGALGRGWNRELVVMAAYLDALPRALASERARAVVFDQGPLYTLCRPPLLSPRLDGWRAARLARWNELLDVVVWLDAPDEVLLARIDARGKEHRLKGAVAADARAALAADRAVYEAALSSLDGPRVLRLDTSALSAAAICGAVLEAL